MNNVKKVFHLLLLSTQTCEQRQVSHFQYLSWPDYGVPTSAVTLIDFLGAVKRQQRKMVKAMGSQWTGHLQGPPAVVHCSAGIGRTGTGFWHLPSSLDLNMTSYFNGGLKYFSIFSIFNVLNNLSLNNVRLPLLT